jgi:hypothetical protein
MPKVFAFQEVHPVEVRDSLVAAGKKGVYAWQPAKYLESVQACCRYPVSRPLK